MKRTAVMGALVLAAVLAGQPAIAQQPSPPSQASPSGGSQDQSVQLPAKSLMGSTVRSQDGKDIGKVSNLMIDPKDGKVAAVVVTMGGRMGMGGKDVTVPWESVQVGRDQQDLVVTMNQSQLPQAPARQDEGGQKKQ